jgi:hypothetical protein
MPCPSEALAKEEGNLEVIMDGVLDKVVELTKDIK